MKKIGITCYPSIGGSGIIATELGMLLAEHGHEVHFITSSLPFRLDRIHPKIYYHEVEVNHYPVFQYPPYDLALANKMADIVDREKLDILHVHYALPHAICAILARDIAEHKVKVVTTLHGTDITVLGIDPTLKKIIQYGINESDAVTAVSNSLAKQTTEVLEVNNPIHVVYNFINEDNYQVRKLPQLKQQYGIQPNDKVFIHISNFRKVKRVEDVIKTFKLVSDQVSAKLLLVGDGPERSYIGKLVDKLKLNDCVLFLGKQKNINDLLSISHIKLLMSEKESFGLVLLEAMACGVPCIATNAGGVPEVIDHGNTGYVVNTGDTVQAADYALKLLDDTQLYEQLSSQSKRLVKNKFSSTKALHNYLQLYNELLDKKLGDKHV